MTKQLANDGLVIAKQLKHDRGIQAWGRLKLCIMGWDEEMSGAEQKTLRAGRETSSDMKYHYNEELMERLRMKTC